MLEFLFMLFGYTFIGLAVGGLFWALVIKAWIYTFKILRVFS